MLDRPHEPKYRSWTEYLQSDSLFKNAIRLQALVRILAKHAGPGSKLLETGFGSGNTGMLLSDIGFDMTLLDVEGSLIDLFQTRFPGRTRAGKIKVVQGDMYTLPFPDHSFDLIYHQGVLEHLTDAQIVCALKQQARVGRIVVVDVPHRGYPGHPYGDERLLSKRTWQRLIREADLEIIEISGRRLPRWMYLLPHVIFLPPLLDRLKLGKWFGMVSIFVCRSLSVIEPI
jgi:ubiquinone/menaquinone biosynthesis C-methylase UbiE